MKTFKGLIGALVLTACVMFAGAAAMGQTAEAPLKKTQALTAGVVEIADDEISSVAIASTLRMSAAEFAGAVSQGALVVAVQAVDDGTSATVSRVRVSFFNADPSEGLLDGSTAAKTGVVVEEGETKYFVVTGAYLGIHGDAGTAKVTAFRVR